jgi:hypothetical protein
VLLTPSEGFTGLLPSLGVAASSACSAVHDPHTAAGRHRLRRLAALGGVMISDGERASVT